MPYACKSAANAPFANVTALPGVPDMLLPNLGNALGGMIMKADLLVRSSYSIRFFRVADYPLRHRWASHMMVKKEQSPISWNWERPRDGDLRTFCLVGGFVLWFSLRSRAVHLGINQQ